MQLDAAIETECVENLVGNRTQAFREVSLQTFTAVYAKPMHKHFRFLHLWLQFQFGGSAETVEYGVDIDLQLHCKYTIATEDS